MKRRGTIYIIVGLFLISVIIGIFMIIRGRSLVKRANEWEKNPQNTSYASATHAQSVRTYNDPNVIHSGSNENANIPQEQILQSKREIDVRDEAHYSQIISTISNGSKLTSSSVIAPDFLVHAELVDSSWSGDNRSFREVAVINYKESKYMVLINSFNSLVVPMSHIKAVHQHYEPHSQKYGSGGTYYEGNTQGVLLETDNGTVKLIGRGISIKKYYQCAERLFTGSSKGKYKRNVWTPNPFVSVPFMILPIINILWQRRWNKRFKKGIKISIKNFETFSQKLIESNIEVPTYYLRV